MSELKDALLTDEQKKQIDAVLRDLVDKVVEVRARPDQPPSNKALDIFCDVEEARQAVIAATLRAVVAWLEAPCDEHERADWPYDGDYFQHRLLCPMCRQALRQAAEEVP